MSQTSKVSAQLQNPDVDGNMKPPRFSVEVSACSGRSVGYFTYNTDVSLMFDFLSLYLLVSLNTEHISLLSVLWRNLEGK